jgi:Na+/H+-dicarboxylate symporter
LRHLARNEGMAVYAKIVISLAIGVVVAGLALPAAWSQHLEVPARMILRLLGAVAPPLILVAVSRALLGADIRGRLSRKMLFLLAMNTLVAIFIGLAVANLVRPGGHASLPPGEAPRVSGSPIAQLLDNVPSSLVRPLVENNVIGVIVVAVAFGLAARKFDEPRQQQMLAVLNTGFDLILVVLRWIIALVPVAVFCKVAFVVGTQGFRPFVGLAWFVVAVIAALALRVCTTLSE